MKTHIRATVACALALCSSALCGQDLDEQPLDPAAKKRLLEQNVNGQTKGNNGFALELYSRIKDRPGNIFCSPYSISAALAIPFAGANAVTKAEMQKVMHYLEQGTSLDESFAWLNQHFTTPFYQGPNETKLYIANSLWVQRDLRILPSFADIVSKYFKAGLKQADFMRNPESARLNINDWVRERTQGRISDLIGSGDLDSSTKLVVVSSIFMKAVWQHPFDPSVTQQASFFADPVKTISIPMMTMSAVLPIYQGSAFTLLELPYRSSNNPNDMQLSMLIFLPNDTFGLSKVESMLTPDQLENSLKLMQRKQVIATIPTFKLADQFNLNNTLEKMGMVTPFSTVADFSGITGTNDLLLTNVLHKAYLSVDEKGTEAVAATAVTIGLKSVMEPKPAIVFTADHPFPFMIVDRSINAILFIGRLVNPEVR